MAYTWPLEADLLPNSARVPCSRTSQILAYLEENIGGVAEPQKGSSFNSVERLLQ
jgi:hypothetical protein